uniref:Tc1-like transposase DDE domain-containing protein n=1 Tax=Chromera velia CCMP2878 TaxID=1169474 RepID=A0A0G4HHH8_9ALVE|eukprot:Cvel_6817.t1-p1 / transcript=Cvel_6817.t1 / gene=Cvel_6817 / organism=Chromera_velia_CCMP2878 / gene_product=hypothetical protein / transcript_product=hypothetical protein / location=Cvel_scaffold343:69522-70775(-) / protein_length=418 / sequence_SO=supercontig / SO=protein_coding / is_pseudo=false
MTVRSVLFWAFLLVLVLRLEQFGVEAGIHSSNEIRRLAVAKWIDGTSIQTIAVFLCLGVRNIENWVKRWKDTGSPDRLKRGPAPRVLQGAQLDVVRELVEDNPWWTLSRYNATLQQMLGVQMTDQTLLNAFKRLGFTRKQLKVMALEKRKEEMDAFVANVRGIHPSCFVWFDEVPFRVSEGVSRFGWSLKGARCLSKERFVDAKQGLMVLAAMTDQELLQHHITSTTVNADLLKDFLQADVLPVMNAFDPHDPQPRSVFIWDNAGPHRALRRWLQEELEDIGALFILLPPHCPEWNPIEMVFGMMKNKMKRDETLSRHLKMFGVDVLWEVINSLFRQNGDEADHIEPRHLRGAIYMAQVYSTELYGNQSPEGCFWYRGVETVFVQHREWLEEMERDDVDTEVFDQLGDFSDDDFSDED